MAIDGLVGVTAIEVRAAGITVKLADPFLPPKRALTTDVPSATPEALLPDTQVEDAVTARDWPSA